MEDRRSRLTASGRSRAQQRGEDTRRRKRRRKVVAIGECGLDYDMLHFCPAEIQKKYFEKQFELAYATKLPMFLHMRAAADDFCAILERHKERIFFPQDVDSAGDALLCGCQE